MTLSRHVDGHVLTLTINRPEALNALDVAAMRGLREQLLDAQDNRDIRVIVLTGAGSRAFCVGADLKSTASSPASYAEAFLQTREPAAQMGLYVRLMDLDLDVSKPMVAAINGYCLGGGLELALACDIRIAAHHASFGLPEVVVGSVPGRSGVHRLLRAIPAAAAMHMALTGERIDASKALAWGLVSETTTPDALLVRATQIAHQIASHAPLVVQAVKVLGARTAHMSYADAQHLTELYWGVLRDTEDRREGRRAFAEKRSPHYQGR